MGWRACLPLPALPPSCVTSSKSLHLSGPQFPHLQNGASKSFHFSGLWGSINETMQLKALSTRPGSHTVQSVLAILLPLIHFVHQHQLGTPWCTEEQVIWGPRDPTAALKDSQQWGRRRGQMQITGAVRPWSGTKTMIHRGGKLGREPLPKFLSGFATC